MRDLRAVINVLGGVANVSRTGLRNSEKTIKGQKTITFNEVTLKPNKEGLKEVKLSKADVEAISKKPVEQQATAILDKFKSAHPENANATIADIADLGQSRKGGLKF